MRKKYKMLVWVIISFGLLTVFFVYRSRIAGTVYGPEMQKIVINEVTYVWDDESPYGYCDKSYHIGKGAWRDGTRVLDLYRIKGDKEFNYLYARFGYEGQMYIREKIKDRVN